MSILLVNIPGKTKKRWKQYASTRGITADAVVGKFLETYMSPLRGTLEATMSLRAKCDKCGKDCDLVYIKSEEAGFNFAYSACCQSSFMYRKPSTP